MAKTRRYKAKEAIVFFKVKEAWGELSNMAPGFPIVVGRVRASSSEALYQALRFPDYPEVQRRVLSLPAWQSKQEARSNVALTRPDWERVRVAAMRWVLRLKAAQHPRFREVLLATGERPIVELSYKDGFWGARPEGEFLVGVNALGRLLMELREELRNGELKIVPPPGAKLLGVEVR